MQDSSQPAHGMIRAPGLISSAGQAHRVASVLPLSEGAAPEEINLDANATTRPLPQVIEEVARVMGGSYGNPSSAHWLGASARSLLEQARDDVAALVSGCFPEGVVFTSGGTEANNAVLRSVLASSRTLLTSRVEHASVLEPARSLAAVARVVYLEVSSDGLLDPDAVAASVAAAGPVCVSIQWANSETGVIQPVRDIAAAIRRMQPDAFIHSDIAQAIGRVTVDLDCADVDVVTFSGHKLHGPQGTGVIALRDPTDRRLLPLIVGGGQERGWRSGTQNLAGCCGLGVAARARAATLGTAAEQLAGMRDEFERKLLELMPHSRVNGSLAARVPNTSSVLIPGCTAMALLARLDSMGLACSAGSACSAGRPEPSHVLTAMGLSEAHAFSTVRFSFSILNTMEQAARAAEMVALAAGEVG